jgi:hypothetical protein
MGYKKFNRHQIFSSEMMTFHSTTIRNIENFYLQKDESMFNNLINMLNGIWDGYLYDDLLSKAKSENLIFEDYCRIESTVDFIKDRLSKEV